MLLCRAALGAQEPQAAFVFYAPAPQPYFDAVFEGARASASELGIRLERRAGSDWSLDEQGAGLAGLAREGFAYAMTYPVVAAEAVSLAARASKDGMRLVFFGAPNMEPALPGQQLGSRRVLTVATDIRAAASKAVDCVAEAMGGKGLLVCLTESPEDQAAVMRREGIAAALKRYPGLTSLALSNVRREAEAVERLSSLLDARKIDGILAAGPMVSSALLKVIAARAGLSGVATLCLDEAPETIEAATAGRLGSALAQNFFCQGYASVFVLGRLAAGMGMAPGFDFFDSGTVRISAANAATYNYEMLIAARAAAIELQRRHLLKLETQEKP